MRLVEGTDLRALRRERAARAPACGGESVVRYPHLSPDAGHARGLRHRDRQAFERSARRAGARLYGRLRSRVDSTSSARARARVDRWDVGLRRAGTDRGKPVDGAVTSPAGRLLYECLTGESPFARLAPGDGVGDSLTPVAASRWRPAVRAIDDVLCNVATYWRALSCRDVPPCSPAAEGRSSSGWRLPAGATGTGRDLLCSRLSASSPRGDRTWRERADHRRKYRVYVGHRPRNVRDQTRRRVAASTCTRCRRRSTGSATISTRSPRPIRRHPSTAHDRGHSCAGRPRATYRPGAGRGRRRCASHRDRRRANRFSTDRVLRGWKDAPVPRRGRTSVGRGRRGSGMGGDDHGITASHRRATAALRRTRGLLRAHSVARLPCAVGRIGVHCDAVSIRSRSARTDGRQVDLGSPWASTDPT